MEKKAERKALLFLFSLILTQLHAGEAGKVAAIAGQATANGKLLTLDASVQEGDLIATSKDGSLKLLMNDRSILDLGPLSRITIMKYESTDEARNVDLNLKYGSVRALIAKKRQQTKGQFNFKTKWGVMAVRGTELKIVDQTESRSVVVVEGLVSMTLLTDNRGSTLAISLAVGQKLELRNGNTEPNISLVSNLELAAIRNDVVPDGTFNHLVAPNLNDRSEAQSGTSKISNSLDRVGQLSYANLEPSGLPSVKALSSDSILNLQNPQAVDNPGAPGGSVTGSGNISAGGAGGVGGAGGGDSPVVTTGLTVTLTL